LHSTPLPHTINGKLRDELLNGEIFYTLKEAQILIEQWRKEYNTVRPLARLQTACTRNYCFELQRKNKKRRKENTDSIT
jgi:hypothetical protein